VSGHRTCHHRHTTSHSWRLWGRLLVALVVGFQLVQAQTPKNKEAQKSQDEVVTLKAHLVTTDVMVKDKKGKYVTDLKAEDFTIFENGVQQKVEFFDPPIVSGNETSQPPAASQPATSTQPKSVPPSGLPTNIISLVVDGSTTELANLKPVREGTIKYIRERIASTDSVAVFGIGNDLQLLQPFTQDKAKLIAGVEKAYASTSTNKNLERAQLSEDIARTRDALNGAGDVNLASSPAAAAQGSAAAQTMIAMRALERFIKMRSQLSVQQARPILAALAAICEAQRTIPGKKTVVLFSQGFVAATVLDWQIQSTIDIANRANVAIYIIDSAGLTANGPQSGAFVPNSPLGAVAATGSPDGRSRAVGGESIFDNVRQEGLSREQDILYRISGDTGGEFLKGNNDIGKGLERMDQEIRARYTLAYYSTDSNFDGNFRKLKVEVRRPDTHPVARAGYYAVATDEIVPLSLEDRKLLAKFAEAESSPALPLFVQMSPFRSQSGHYVVPLTIEVPPSAVQFDRKGEVQQLHLDVLGLIREDQDKILSRLGSNFDVGLGPEPYQLVLNNNIFYRQDMELPPGDYTIELIVRDRMSGKMAAKKTKLVLPAPDAEFATSGVVLSRLALPVKTPPVPGEVLRLGSAQIRPSSSREFRSTDNLIFFFELYNAATQKETGKPQVKVTITLLKDGQAVIKPIDYALTDALAQPVPHLTFAKYIKLTGLPAGNYSALIEARDMVTQRLVTQRAAFVITQ
jgi:VWFA-related protein